jgi:hypothetical protein
MGKYTRGVAAEASIFSFYDKYLETKRHSSNTDINNYVSSSYTKILSTDKVWNQITLTIKINIVIQFNSS